MARMSLSLNSKSISLNKSSKRSFAIKEVAHKNQSQTNQTNLMGMSAALGSDSDNYMPNLNN